jgi:hypothetical protein
LPRRWRRFCKIKKEARRSGRLPIDETLQIRVILKKSIQALIVILFLKAKLQLYVFATQE